MDFLLDDTKKRPGKNPEPPFFTPAAARAGSRASSGPPGSIGPAPATSGNSGPAGPSARRGCRFPGRRRPPSAERLKRGAGAKSDDLLPKPLLAKKEKKTDPPPSEGGKSAFAAINKILLKSGVRSARTVLPRQWEPRPPAPGSSSRPRRACQTRPWRRR